LRVEKGEKSAEKSEEKRQRTARANGSGQGGADGKVISDQEARKRKRIPRNSGRGGAEDAEFAEKRDGNTELTEIGTQSSQREAKRKNGEEGRRRSDPSTTRTGMQKPHARRSRFAAVRMTSWRPDAPEGGA